MDTIPTANNDAYDELPTLSPYEQIKVIAETAHLIANDWATRPAEGLGTEERVMGAVHDTLAMLQNGYMSVPAMQLIPLDPGTEEGCMTHVFRDNVQIMADWAYDKPMVMKVEMPDSVVGAAYYNRNPHVSVTRVFADQYEAMRQRYRTAALDLFGQGEKDA